MVKQQRAAYSKKMSEKAWKSEHFYLLYFDSSGKYYISLTLMGSSNIDGDTLELLKAPFGGGEVETWDK